MNATTYRNFDAPKRPQRVSITWRMETPEDDSGVSPEDRNEGFWPSQDPEAVGYVEPDFYAAAMEEAQARWASWERDDWGFVGVVAVAEIALPIGGGSFVTHTLRSAGCWGVESDAGDYLRELYEEQKAELMHQMGVLAAALQSGEFDQEEA